MQRFTLTDARKTGAARPGQTDEHEGTTRRYNTSKGDINIQGHQSTTRESMKQMHILPKVLEVPSTRTVVDIKRALTASNYPTPQA
jgi:hypothetical protein